MFGQVYNSVMKPLDQIGFRDWRAWATDHVCGRVLEIGAGTGLNFGHYDVCADVIAFDPDPDMLEEVESAHHAPTHITLLRASAEELPFPDDYFDSAVGTLVFCTIPNPSRALAEIRRVLKPGAPLRLVEHVRSRNPLLAGVMDAATPLWKHVAGGCHLNRNTPEIVRRAGFEILSIQKRWAGLLVGIDAKRKSNEQ